MRRFTTFFSAALVLSMALTVSPVGASAGEDKPKVVVGDPEKAKGKFDLVGHDALRNRGMNAGLAVHGDYAYVGSRTDGLHPNAGVLVVDVSDPSAPTVVHEIGKPNESNIGETSRELRVLPEQELLVVMNLGSNCSFIIHACSPTQLTVDDNYRFYDISGDKAAAPELVSEYVPSVNPHEFFLWDDPKNKGRTLMFQSTPGGGQTHLLVTDVSKARSGKFPEIFSWATVIPDPETDNRLHSLTVTPDGKRAHLAYLGGGLLELDISDIAAGAKKPEAKLVTDITKRAAWGDPGAHSAVKLFNQDYVLASDEVYGQIPGLLPDHGCPWGWVRIIDIRDHADPKIATEFKLPENTQESCDDPTFNTPERNALSSYSAHNPTLTQNLALITWHSAGLQAIDLSKPTSPKLAAQYRPEPLPAVTQEDPVLSSGRDKVVMWSFPIIKDGLIYVVDVRNGLYILEYKGPHEKEVSSVKFLEGNTNFGDTMKIEK